MRLLSVVFSIVLGQGLEQTIEQKTIASGVSRGQNWRFSIDVYLYDQPPYGQIFQVESQDGDAGTVDGTYGYRIPTLFADAAGAPNDRINLMASTHLGGNTNYWKKHTVDKNTWITIELSEVNGVYRFVVDNQVIHQANNPGSNPPSWNNVDVIMGSPNGSSGPANGLYRNFVYDLNPQTVPCPVGWTADSIGICHSPCLNDAWQTDDNGDCQPKPSHFDLQCTASGMVLTIDEAVYPDGEGVTLLDSSCVGTKTGNTWTINSALDDCQTTMALVTNTDGSESLAFSNKVKFNSFSADAKIYTQNQVYIDFTCNYDSTYDDIEVSDVTVVSENVDADAQDVDGQFNFGLVQYMDSEMSDPADAGDQTPLGGTMYFQLTKANPVSTLDWVIRDCVVHDDALSLSYSIITNQCPDSNTQVQVTPVGTPKSAINFSYMGFKFTNSVDNQQADMRLTCSVTVCDASDATSTCAAGCV